MSEPNEQVLSCCQWCGAGIASIGLRSDVVFMACGSIYERNGVCLDQSLRCIKAKLANMEKRVAELLALVEEQRACLELYAATELRLEAELAAARRSMQP